MVVMRRIVDENWPVKYPPYLSPEAKDLIGRLLERKPGKRLGMLSGRARDIKSHKWFAGFDWAALEARKMEAPRKPQNDNSKRLKELAVWVCTTYCCVFVYHVQSAYTHHMQSVHTHTQHTHAQQSAYTTTCTPIMHNIRHAQQSAYTTCTHIMHNTVIHNTTKEDERRNKKEPQETPEELAECQQVFADF